MSTENHFGVFPSISFIQHKPQLESTVHIFYKPIVFILQCIESVFIHHYTEEFFENIILNGYVV